jgi:RNA polymerase sporulation-specific sigma factor
MDKIPSDNKEEDVIDKVILKSVIKELSTKEKKIIILRYFRDFTQGDIAKLLGVSQVHVSRLENKILQKIRQKFEEK